MVLRNYRVEKCKKNEFISLAYLHNITSDIFQGSRHVTLLICLFSSLIYHLKFIIAGPARVRQMENMEIISSCVFGGSTGDDEGRVHPLQLCVHTLVFCPRSTHLLPSSLHSICHPRLPSLKTLCSTTSVSQECHFSPLLGLYGFKETRFPFPLPLNPLPLCSLTSSSSSSLTSHTIISPD